MEDSIKTPVFTGKKIDLSQFDKSTYEDGYAVGRIEFTDPRYLHEPKLYPFPANSYERGYNDGAEDARIEFSES